MSGKDISISIIGNIEEKYKDDFMKEYGFYEVRDLPSILEKLSVNLIFMPSICPETFSYVTHEVIQMKIPLVCFNLGAQAEATISYNKGKVIPLNLPTEEIYRKIEKHFYDVRTQEKNVV